ncbi:hypothetical protein ACSBR2_032940 [Camellia fascicularis]
MTVASVLVPSMIHTSNVPAKKTQLTQNGNDSLLSSVILCPHLSLYPPLLSLSLNTATPKTKKSSKSKQPNLSTWPHGTHLSIAVIGLVWSVTKPPVVSLPSPSSAATSPAKSLPLSATSNTSNP